MKKSDAFEKLKERIKSDKKLLIIIAISFVGIIIIGFSNVNIFKTNSNKSEATSEENLDKYAEILEERLCDMISSIDGAGETKVMITMDSGIEKVYAKQSDRQEKSNLDNSTVGGLLEESYSEKNEYILIENDETGEGGLIVKIIQPEVRGVAIVCEGGESAYVREQIMNAARAVLDINATKISISKMSNK